METFLHMIHSYLSMISLPRVGIIDVIEILLISFFIYEFMLWVRTTRAYTLLQGILVVVIFIVLAYLLQMQTILWIVQRMGTLFIVALMVIFQPELRKALEQLGEHHYFSSFFPMDQNKKSQARFSDKTISEIVRACFDMAADNTGALIVMEGNVVLTDYVRTGIMIDSVISSQLLINIFEHNTPLHDGAVIVRKDRIVAATCYLPLSDNMDLSKQLGTRHRAGVGMSEVSDSLTIIVSEETGFVSTAQGGKLRQHVSQDELREILRAIQGKNPEDSRRSRLWRRRETHDKKTVQ